MARIKLTASDMLLACMAGSLRRIENMAKGTAGYHGFDDGKLGDFQADIIGSMAELAVCRYLRVDWPGKGKMRGPDAGENLQVRSSESQTRCRLPIYESDDDDCLFYLVRRIGMTNEFEIHKPMFARDVKVPGNWDTELRAPTWMATVAPL